MDLGSVLAGRYRLDEKVGAGGMGVVWRATDLELRRVVAIKQTTDARREARIGAGLAHPNVIGVFDVIGGEDDARLLVMEYLPSRTLAQVLREDGPLPPDEAARVGAQIAGALGAMHASGMVHRDITPNNVLIADDGTTKLSDLGVAMWAGVTITGGEQRVAGTPGYVAPEVLAGQATTSASDMYALGITLSAAVEGAEEDTASWLGIVLSALTNENPKRRPTAAQAREMLVEVSGDTAGNRRRVPIQLVAGALVLVGALVAGWLLWPNDEPSTSLVGDPRTVDPCGLIAKATLARFGKPTLERDFGEFNRCDVWVSPDGTDENEAQLTVWVEKDPDEGTSLSDGTIRSLYPPEENNRCERILQLPDRYGVRVTVTHKEGALGDLCAMADALYTGVLSVVANRDLPRTAVPKSPAIASADACTMLTSDDVDRVMGDLPQDPPGYAGWNCSWTGADERVSIYFVRDWPLSGDNKDVTDVAGHEASIDSSGEAGEDTCVVRVVHRTYRSNGHEAFGTTTKTEQFWIEVSSNGPMAEQCQRAEQLATVAAGRLPA
jgi:eukaryotic-like serine/threonine-protein kinase